MSDFLGVLRSYQEFVKRKDLESDLLRWHEYGEINAVDDKGELYTHPERLRKEMLKIIRRMIDGRTKIKPVFDEINKSCPNNADWFGLPYIVWSAIRVVVYDQKEREDYRTAVAVSEKITRLADELRGALSEAVYYADGRGINIPIPILSAKVDREFDNSLRRLTMVRLRGINYYLDPPSRQVNHSGAFVQHLDEAFTDIGIRLSNPDMATLAEVCLGLPHGAVNPKSIRHKRVKLDA